jgi:hypothetical protein
MKKPKLPEHIYPLVNNLIPQNVVFNGIRASSLDLRLHHSVISFLTVDLSPALIAALM